jgi:hypothetical protein
MHGRNIRMLVLPALVLSCSCTAAACDLAEFDRAPPPAIRSSVTNQFAHFEWASDADKLPSGAWIWNYLTNRGAAGLGARWKKAKIDISKWNPLPPGETFCYQYLVDALREKPDTDAPIIYGTNDQRQEAAAYIADVRAASPTNAVIQTTVIDSSGKRRPVRIDLSTSPTDGGFTFSLDHASSSDLIVGISTLSTALNKSQIESIMVDVKKQTGGNVELASLAKFAGDNADKFVATAFLTPEETKERLTETYLFFSNAGKVGVKVQEKSPQQREAEVILLDKDRRPLFAVSVTLLAPSP